MRYYRSWSEELEEDTILKLNLPMREKKILNQDFSAYVVMRFSLNFLLSIFCKQCEYVVKVKLWDLCFTRSIQACETCIALLWRCSRERPDPNMNSQSHKHFLICMGSLNPPAPFVQFAGINFQPLLWTKCGFVCTIYEHILTDETIRNQLLPRIQSCRFTYWCV